MTTAGLWPPADSADAADLREENGAAAECDCDQGWIAGTSGRVRRCPACRPAGGAPARSYTAEDVDVARRVAQRDLAADLGFASTQELAAYVAAARRQETAR